MYLNNNNFNKYGDKMIKRNKAFEKLFVEGMLFGLAQASAEGCSSSNIASVLINAGVTKNELANLEIEPIDLEYLEYAFLEAGLINKKGEL